MKLQELSKMSLAELQAMADERLARNEDPTASDETRAAYITQAQLYIGEINRRSDARHARRDFWMEVAVIALIALELVAAVYEVKETRANATQAAQQIDILKKLNDSASSTADTLSALRTAQERSLETQGHTLDNIITMNTALQDAMGLNYAVAMDITYDEGATRLNFTNKGKTNLYLWGSRLDGNVALEKEARLVSPQGTYSISISALKNEVSEKLPKGTGRLIPYDVFVRAANKKSYIVKAYLAVRWEGDMLKIGTQVASVSAGKW